ncbi:hypothetical protein J6590_005135 [Homalodisca vitripennis]|nr:hypothetical protein J6590_005135 [Homalodisca vitripennis]
MCESANGLGNFRTLKGSRTGLQLVVNMYNRCLQEITLDNRWKTKENHETPSPYRLYARYNRNCMLLEQLLRLRFVKTIEAGGGLSDRQHAYRAMAQVLDFFEAAERAVDLYDSGPRWREILAEAAQVSILDLTCGASPTTGYSEWKLPEGSFHVEYADDITVTISARPSHVASAGMEGRARPDPGYEEDRDRTSHQTEDRHCRPGQGGLRDNGGKECGEVSRRDA